MSDSSWGTKSISVSISMATGGSFSTSSLPIECAITKPGLPACSAATVRIYGMSLENMSAATVLPFKIGERLQNKITIEATYNGGMATVFKGEIMGAYADFSSAPDVTFLINALEGGYGKGEATNTSSADEGSNVEIGTKIEEMASKVGKTVVNYGVTGTVDKFVTSGDPITQISQTAKGLGFNAVIDGDEVVIFPRGGYRSGLAVPTLSGSTGLLGYPKFTTEGIQARCLFNPLIKWGGLIELDSIVPRASGQWIVTALNHSITCRTSFEGPWETTFEGVPSDQSGTIYSTV